MTISILEINRLSTREDKMANVNNDLASQVALILDRLAKMDEKMDAMVKSSNERLAVVEGKVHDIQEKQDSFEKEINDVRRNQELGSEMAVGIEYETKMNTEKGRDNEQYQRNFNIRIINLNESENETIYECEEKVMQLFNEKLGVKVKIDDIDVLHRLGPKKKNKKSDATSDTHIEPKNDDKSDDNVNGSEETMELGHENTRSDENKNTDLNESSPIDVSEGYSRPIIVSFIARRIRRQVLENRSKLKKRPGQTTRPIIITEDLTKWHYALLCKARDSEMFDGGVWPKDGKIFGKQNGRVRQIRGFADVVAPPEGGPDSKVFYRTNRGGRRGFQRGYHRPRRGWGVRGRGTSGIPSSQLFGQGQGGIPNPTPRASPYLDRGLVSVSNKFDALQNSQDNFQPENV